jgi:hypothetical protein
MVHATVEDVIASFPHPILPTVQGGADYHIIHSINKLLRTKDRFMESHLGGGALGNLSIIVSITTYATVAPAQPWANPEPPGGAPNEIIGGTAAVLLAERHRWEEAVIIFRTCTAMEQAMKKYYHGM